MQLKNCKKTIKQSITFSWKYALFVKIKVKGKSVLMKGYVNEENFF